MPSFLKIKLVLDRSPFKVADNSFLDLNISGSTIFNNKMMVNVIEWQYIINLLFLKLLFINLKKNDYKSYNIDNHKRKSK